MAYSIIYQYISVQDHLPIRHIRHTAYTAYISPRPLAKKRANKPENWKKLQKL